MSLNTKNGSDNVSCTTNPCGNGVGGCGSGSPLVTPEPKGTNHTSKGSRPDLHYSSLKNTSRLHEQHMQSSKWIRILTVLAYIVAVSMAAIILSVYYTFIWNPYQNPKTIDINNANELSRQKINWQKKIDMIDIQPTMYNLDEHEHELVNREHMKETYFNGPYSESISSTNQMNVGLNSNVYSNGERKSPVTRLLLSGLVNNYNNKTYSMETIENYGTSETIQTNQSMPSLSSINKTTTNRP
ncbi:hypothetical protein BLOT_004359 [Blomia tropicalis]|nr:hypothetical protein BLOT_004359 [Blomia tropicalis]